MQRVYVVTHPEATHHVQELVGGWYDSRLTGRGLVQATRIARHLREIIPEGADTALYSSDLLRTRQTAQALQREFGIAPVLEPGLREKSYGVAGGRAQSWLDVRFIFPPETGERLDHDEGIEGGETKRQWIQRAYAAVSRITGDGAGHRIIVTHAGTASWAIAAWLGIPLESCAYLAFRVGSGSLTILEKDDVFHNRSLVSLGRSDFA